MVKGSESMDIDKVSVGNRIRSIRKEKGLTMEEFGKFIDKANKSAVGNWERGDNLPNNARLKMIAQFGEITVDELLKGESNMNKQEQDAINRIRESLEEFPDSRMAQYVTAEDLKTLLKLAEKTQKNSPPRRQADEGNQ